jgi:hypothetical protein
MSAAARAQTNTASPTSFSAPLSARQQRIIDYARTRSFGSVHPRDWSAVPLPDAPISEEQMRGSLERLTARGLFVKRASGRYRLVNP